MKKGERDTEREKKKKKRKRESSRREIGLRNGVMGMKDMIVMRCKKRGEGKREGINMNRKGLRELERREKD